MNLSCSILKLSNSWKSLLTHYSTFLHDFKFHSWFLPKYACNLSYMPLLFLQQYPLVWIASNLMFTFLICFLPLVLAQATEPSLFSLPCWSRFPFSVLSSVVFSAACPVWVYHSWLWIVVIVLKNPDWHCIPALCSAPLSLLEMNFPIGFIIMFVFFHSCMMPKAEMFTLANTW